jgi:hypothetical protein
MQEDVSMQVQTEWKVGPDAWADFVARHPELGFKSGRWPFHNFLRLHRTVLVKRDAIRLAKRRFWIAHVERFCAAAFDCATGAPSPQHDGVCP